MIIIIIIIIITIIIIIIIIIIINVIIIIMAVQTSGCPEYKIKCLARRQTVKPAAASTKICRKNYAIFCAKKKNKLGKNDLIKVS